MSNKLHPEYVATLELAGIHSLSSQLLSAQSVFVDKSISRVYQSLDDLRSKYHEDIAALKQTHTSEILELKLKLSNLIDTNYNLMLLLNKDSHAKD
jgi:hypothetical protein